MILPFIACPKTKKPVKKKLDRPYIATSFCYGSWLLLLFKLKCNINLFLFYLNE